MNSAAPAPGQAVEDVHVDAAGEVLALGAHEQRAAGRPSASERGDGCRAPSRAPNRLSGGSSMTRTPRSPSRSSRARSATAELLRRPRRARPPRRLGGWPAAGADRRRSAGSRACAGGRRSARRPARSELSRFTPSQPSRVAHPSAPGAWRRPTVCRDPPPAPREVPRVVARDHERVPARPRVDVHERHRVLVLLDDLARAARPPRSCRRCSRPPWAMAAGSLQPAGALEAAVEELQIEQHHEQHGRVAEVQCSSGMCSKFMP